MPVITSDEEDEIGEIKHTQIQEFDETSDKRQSESSSTTISRDTLNLRENARNRIQRAKEKTRLKFLREKSISATRFDHVIREEESSSLDLVVEKVLARRRAERSSEVDLISPLDFFTREWSDVVVEKIEIYPSLREVNLENEGFVKRFVDSIKESRFWKRISRVPQPPPSPVQLPGTSAAKASEVEETPKDEPRPKEPKISSHDLISSPVEWSHCPQVPAFVIPSNVRVKWEKELYYFPSTKPPIINDEFGNAYSWFRNLEDEGFYVGPKARISSKNRNKIKNRLITERSFKFFGADFELEQGENPFFLTSFNRQRLSSDDEWGDQLISGIGLNLCSGMNESGSRYQLDIHVKNIQFLHHHLFSIEHVYASKLMQLCERLETQENRDLISLINSRLQIVASAIENIVIEDELVENDKRKRLKTYLQEMRQLRKQKDDEEFLNRSLLKNILDLWTKLKDLRIKQGFINTNILMQINKIDTDIEEDEKNWKKEIQIEFEEKKLLHKVRKFVKEKSKKKKKKKVKLDENVDDKFDRIQILKNIKEKAMNQRRRPGEPQLQPVLTHGGVVSSFGCASIAEQKRRTHLDKIKLFLRILYNGKEVCRTISKNFNDDFTIDFNQMYNLHVFQRPEKITLQVFELKNLWNFNIGNNLIAEIYLPIPNTNTTSETAKFEHHSFSEETEYKHDHNGVGCGTNVNLILQTESLFTQGIITCASWWAMDFDGKILSPMLKDENEMGNARKIRDQLGTAGIVDRNQLGTWINESHIDPNDPSNGRFLHLIRDSSGTDVSEQSKYSPLDNLMDEFNFVTDDVIEENIRFKLLSLREQQIPEFQGLLMIPINPREIPSNIFEEYNRRQTEDKINFDVDDIFNQKAKVEKYLKQIFDVIRQHHKNILHKTILENIVTEEQVPDIRTLSLAMLRIAEPLRPLRPLRKEGKQIPTQLVTSPSINILITVVRGFNIPERRDNSRVSSTRRVVGGGVSSFRSPREPIDLESSVNPFVEVSFQRNRVKTSVAEGSNPTWNQRLTLPLQIPTNFENIRNIKEIIYLNIFDEVRTDVLEDERDRDVRVHQRIERHWLGVLRIPFTTLYFNSRIEGTFKVDSPPVYLGYAWNRDTFIPDEGIRAPNSTYLSLFITLDPGLPLIDKFDMKLEGESEALTEYGEKWLEELSNPCIRRVIKAFVLDYEGCAVFIPRFINPLNPPNEILDLKLPVLKTMELLARFVSLIPRHDISTDLSSTCDIWTTCDKMFVQLCGSGQEHAVLLCNYFLFLDQSAWLAYGTAIPEGPTAYVLTENDGNYYLWRSTTGECFNYRDHFSPMIRIDCLINQQNIWANTNPYTKSSLLNFNLHKNSLWKPFFTKSYPNPGLTTVQPEQLIYNKTNENNIEKLEKTIERTIRDKIMEWRSRHRTPWNRHCNRILKNILPKLEQIRNHQTIETDFIQDELADILTAYKINGFPLDFNYTDLNSICESVYATGVHSFEHPEAEFSLGVYIHPYQNNVIAIWIYIAALIKR